jgi:hypothetical protein
MSGALAQALPSRVCSWPCLQILEQALKAVQGQTLYLI